MRFPSLLLAASVLVAALALSPTAARAAIAAEAPAASASSDCYQILIYPPPPGCGKPAGTWRPPHRGYPLWYRHYRPLPAYSYGYPGYPTYPSYPYPVPPQPPQTPSATAAVGTIQAAPAVSTCQQGATHLLIGSNGQTAYQLVGGGVDLNRFLGQRVRVAGTVTSQGVEGCAALLRVNQVQPAW